MQRRHDGEGEPPANAVRPLALEQGRGRSGGQAPGDFIMALGNSKDERAARALVTGAPRLRNSWTNELVFTALAAEDTVVEGDDARLTDTVGQDIETDFGNEADISVEGGGAASAGRMGDGAADGRFR